MKQMEMEQIKKQQQEAMIKHQEMEKAKKKAEMEKAKVVVDDDNDDDESRRSESESDHEIEESQQESEAPPSRRGLQLPSHGPKVQGNSQIKSPNKPVNKRLIKSSGRGGGSEVSISVDEDEESTPPPQRKAGKGMVLKRGAAIPGNKKQGSRDMDDVRARALAMQREAGSEEQTND